MRRALVAMLLLAAACAREKPYLALADDLTAMRKAILAYRTEQGRYPQRLQDLVPKYLRAVPLDPITGKSDWRVITEEPVVARDFGSSAPPAARGGGIIDVRSAAAGHDDTGRSWSDY